MDASDIYRLSPMSAASPERPSKQVILVARARRRRGRSLNILIFQVPNGHPVAEQVCSRLAFVELPYDADRHVCILERSSKRSPQRTSRPCPSTITRHPETCSGGFVIRSQAVSGSLQ